MNNVQRGCCRDRRIVNLVEHCGVLDTEQVACLVFAGMKAGYRKAQQRLKRLYDTKRLKRCRLALEMPYCYYVERPRLLEHRLALNWVYTWANTARLASWDRMAAWEYEPDYGILRPDAFFAVENTFTRQYNCYFVELDRSNNSWDKARKYNQLYDAGGYGGRWWVKYTDRFPAVLCVTREGARAKRIQEANERDNLHGLRFDIILLGEVKESCRK